MTPAFDVVLAGNGIIAQAIAIELKRRCSSMRVALIGPSGRPGAGSAAAGAMLGCFGEVTHASLKSRAGRAKADLCRQSARRWRIWTSEINDHCSCDERPSFVRGTVVIENAVSGTLDSDNFDAIVAALTAEGEPFEHVAPRDIAGLHPVPSARPTRALYLPREDAINSQEVHRWMLKMLARLGVELLDCSVARLVTSDSVIKGVVIESGEQIDAPTVVCAAGARTTPLLDTVLDPNQVQPVFAGAGIAFVSNRARTTALSHAIRTVNRGGSCGLHVVPLGAGHEYIGATNAIVHCPATRATAGLSHFLLQCAIDQLDQWYAHSLIDHWRVGNRPVTLDTFPLIGPGGVPGLYVATGTYRDGFMCSPVIGQLIADQILDRGPPPEHPFSPTRPLISTYTVAESIDECTRHAVCTGFEASLVLPRLWPHDMLYESFGSAFGRVCKTLNLPSGLAPDLIPFLASAYPQHDAFHRVRSYLSARGMTCDTAQQ